MPRCAGPRCAWSTAPATQVQCGWIEVQAHPPLPGTLSLQKDLGGGCKPGDSLWTIEDETLSLVLAKAEEGGTWPRWVHPGSW